MESNRKSKKFTITAAVVIVLSLFLLGFFVCFLPLHRARECARSAKCLSNLKQLGLGLKQYSMENDEVFAWGDSASISYYRYLGKLHPEYAPDLTIFTCLSSRDHRMDLADRGASGKPFKKSECRKGLSYAYGHNQGKPWTENDPSTVRLAADKYATQDYTSGPFPKGRRINHWRSHGKPLIGRNAVHADGSGIFDKSLTPLEADPETQIDEDTDPRTDQRGPDWFSDPPDK